ncbi:creatininase family protein [Scatolibacter rhodanostii]|uniref:creatininase family protein n=1 Tax=Scatolibacter rhodanostii TaxID=2014781 RepID=UPI000C07C61A|nr:creatininase family protein [Scatolibacter rhodanostii]
MNYSIFSDTIADMNWLEIEEKGKEKVPVLFPLGVIEEHGPHLPLGTDIYWSYAICKMIKDALNEKRTDCLIAPPYYWGINHCTGSFPGTFSVKPETMTMVLIDIFENLHQFGFNQVYCINYHGDALHIKTILDSIKSANEKFNMNIRLLMEPYDLYPLGLSGKEDYILLDSAEYPPELFVEDDADKKDLFDIHAGAFETAAMDYFYPLAVRKEIIKPLKSYSLTKNGLSVWLSGGENVKSVAPLGYAGNPAGYERNSSTVELVFKTLVDYCANKIIEYNSQK